ncbi:MAG: GHKL domain-containing protein [Ruminococcus sp.]|nr:GHKL domain-containing protein [Ruminococcus sp.]
MLPFNCNSLSTHTITLFTVRFIMLASSLTICKRRDTFTVKDRSEIIPNHIYILILIVLFIENGLIRDLNHTTVNVELKMSIAEYLVMILIIFTSALIISLAVNAAGKNYYLMINTVLERQNKIQLAHYEKVEQFNSEIRRFRHDYFNHMNCIANMIEVGKNDETLTYIKNMSGILPAEKFLIKTGNYIADAVLSDKQDEAAKHNAQIVFDGIIPQEINSTDLCIILSNALDNAVEACGKIPDRKTISVYGNYQQGCVVLIIKNPTAVDWDISQGLPPTSKGDDKNHGWGLLNIQRAVKKYDGNMNISVSDNTFILSISFNPKIGKS